MVIILCCCRDVLISSHLYKVYSSCGFQQGNNIGITSSTCKHCTLSNYTMCSNSYPIPILSLFFLYHAYIPYFLIQRIFYVLVSFPFLLHACMHTRCSHQVYNSNDPSITAKGPQYKKPILVTNKGPSGYTPFSTYLPFIMYYKSAFVVVYM